MAPMPTAGTYRGVPLHAFQSWKRIDRTVKSAIDAVYSITDAQELFDYAADNRNPPEARLFAGARCEASYQIAAEERTVRPAIDLDSLHAATAGLDSREWVDPTRYSTALDPLASKAPARETPLSDEDLLR